MTTTTKQAVTFTVRGTVINGTIIKAYAKRIGGLDDIITNWANAACLEAAAHGNTNWLNELFTMPLLRLASGELSKAGTEVLAYCKAFFPRVQYNKKTGKAVLTAYDARSPLCTNFMAVGLTADDLDVTPATDTVPTLYAYNGTAVTVVADKLYMAQGDFRLTFDEFKNLEKAAAPAKEEASIKASTFKKQVEKVIEANKASKFVGSPEEMAAALAAVAELYKNLSGQQSAAAANAMPIDTMMAGQLLKSGQAGKSVRAGGKVAVKEVA